MINLWNCANLTCKAYSLSDAKFFFSRWTPLRGEYPEDARNSKEGFFIYSVW